jgi:hypothetical protein
VRITLEDVRVTGRNTQGVIVWRDREADDYVASIACFQESDTQSPSDAPATPKAQTNGKSETPVAEEALIAEEPAEEETDDDETGEEEINEQETEEETNEDEDGEEETSEE